MANDPFSAVAHPLRRRIVERLAHGPATVGVVTRGFGVSKPTVSRHLKVLENAGVVVRTVRGRAHQLDLNVAPLVEASDWFDRQRVVWSRMFDAVDDLLRETDDLPASRTDARQPKWRDGAPPGERIPHGDRPA
jgi:DNA-binding transcriptional ArsR family regulator